MCCRRCDASVDRAKRAILDWLFTHGPTRCSWLPENVEHGLGSSEYDFYVSALKILLDEGSIMALEAADWPLGPARHFRLSEAKEKQMLEEQIVRLAHGTWRDRDYITRALPHHLRDRFEEAVKTLVEQKRIVLKEYGRILDLPSRG